MTDFTRPLGIVNRDLPGAYENNTERQPRLSRRGEQFAYLFDRFAAADEGTYFVAHNATNDASTTIAGHPAPVLADADATLVKPFLHLVHSGAVTSQVRCYLDFIEIEVVTAGANGTQACWAMQLDNSRGITTPGTALTKVNPNMQSSAASVLSPTAGPIVVPAETAAVRHLGHGTHRPSIEIAGDKKLYLFGRDPVPMTPTAATAIRTDVVHAPPVILGPNDVFLLALHGQAAQDAAGVYKVRMGWVER
jgi:hypothetical protein